MTDGRPLINDDSSTLASQTEKLEAVFISDLHLNPDDSIITERFERFILWAAQHTRTLYILGDFFHVWSGDDSIDAWSHGIIQRLAWLNEQGVKTYFMAGNRDFLLGDTFATHAKVQILAEPCVITLGQERCLLVHGDRYCTKDRSHQRLMRLTRNRLFARLFLRLPLTIRSRLVDRLRQSSQNNRSKSMTKMNVVVSAMLNHMRQFDVNTVIHGHTHQPGLKHYMVKQKTCHQYVLSDWDDNPLLLCYDITHGLYFNRFLGNTNG